MSVQAAADQRVDELLARVCAGYAPPPRLTVSEFCDAELVVPTGPLAGTRWRTAAYQRGILDAFHEDGIETVVLMASSQVGKTSIALNLIAYHVAHDSCPILVVEPTVDPMAKDFSKNRLDRLISSTPVLRDRFTKRRAKDSTNTTYLKSFTGGELSIAGANSAASLASRPVRLLLLDEVDRYPPELRGEGNTIEIARARTKTYRGRRRIMLLSSPTMVGAPIHAWFQRGDQRHFHVPCPECGLMHALRWANVRWADADPETARIHCPDCDHGMDDAERVAQLEHGEWVAERPEGAGRGIASFHLWEGYSMFSSLREIVAAFMHARKQQKAGDQSEMHTWQNTTLGEPVEHDAGDGVDPGSLLVRREEYSAAVPAGACVVTMGVDTQDDRLEALVIGWGPGEESWIVDRHVLPGDTSQPEPWEMLDELLAREYQHETGQRLPIAATCMDSAGHRTSMVYDYCHRQAARRVFATIGRDGQRPLVSSPSPRRWGTERRKVPLYTIGVDAAKALIVSRLSMTEKGPGYVHVPTEDWADEEMAAQLTSERLVTRWHRGVPKQAWKKTRPRNEMLDCKVMALAALRLLHPDLEQLARRLRNPGKSEPKQDPEKQPERWISRDRRGGWFGRDR